MSDESKSEKATVERGPEKFVYGGIIFVAITAVLSFMFWNANGAMINIMIATCITVLLCLLFSQESKKNTLEFKEVFLGLAILATGFAGGSSATLGPWGSQVWDRLGLGMSHLEPLSPPTKDMWSLQGNTIQVTTKVPNEQDLAVKIKFGHGIFVPRGTSYELPSIEGAEVYLQDRMNGRTSSSVPIK